MKITDKRIRSMLIDPANMALIVNAYNPALYGLDGVYHEIMVSFPVSEENVKVLEEQLGCKASELEFLKDRKPVNYGFDVLQDIARMAVMG